jgi:hypothetical protein
VVGLVLNDLDDIPLVLLDVELLHFLAESFFRVESSELVDVLIIVVAD